MEEDDDGEAAVPICFDVAALACFMIVFCALWNKREEVSILGTRTYGRHTVVFAGAAGISREI